jgi:hypothetical protein
MSIALITRLVLLLIAVLPSGSHQSTQPQSNQPQQQDKKSPNEVNPFASIPHMKVPAEMERLRYMIGVWDVKEHWEHVEGFAPGGDGTAVETITSGPGGMSFIMDYKATGGPFPMYVAHGMLSWELDLKAYRMAWAQPIWPGISIESGHFEGDDLILSYEIVEMGQKYIAKNIYTNLTENSFRIVSYLIDSEGTSTKTVSLELNRRR